MAEETSITVPAIEPDDLIVDELVFDPALVRRANQRGNEITVGKYARATASALATKMFTALNRANNDNVGRPTHVIPAVHPVDKSHLLLIPVHNGDSPSALKILYHRSSFQINLYPVFKGLNRLPLPGYRDVYNVTRTKQPVKLGGLTSHALVIKVDQKITEPIRVAVVTKIRRQTAALMREAAAVERQAHQAQARREAQAKLAAALELLPKD